MAWDAENVLNQGLLLETFVCGDLSTLHSLSRAPSLIGP